MQLDLFALAVALKLLPKGQNRAAGLEPALAPLALEPLRDRPAAVDRRPLALPESRPPAGGCPCLARSLKRLRATPLEAPQAADLTPRPLLLIMDPNTYVLTAVLNGFWLEQGALPPEGEFTPLDLSCLGR
jgi:hypothetical protein